MTVWESVNHVMNRDTQIFFMLQTPAFKIQHKTLTRILLSTKETAL